MTGKMGDEVTPNSKLGRLTGQAITVALYNNKEERSLKGVEIPTGPITFDMTFKYEQQLFAKPETPRMSLQH
ncbi:hypothetical protein MGH68_01925 [Erysipelothrix sp. D19-032]